MIAIVDYGAGNLGSVQKALAFLGADFTVTRDAAVLRAADGVILPGVGAFGDAMRSLNESDLTDAVRGCALSGKPFLGICLGYQILFGASDESPGVRGLGLLPGKVLRIPFAADTALPNAAETYKVPHMGWNSLDLPNACPLFAGIDSGAYVYFVHSYFVRADVRGEVAATTHYTTVMDAAVRREKLFGVQFHPEKSGAAGLAILKNFVEMTT
ncbi:MAG: imidazole glycerol phosphate synthase subunit HisH [Oscillospiraceae bacterium]|nr:imidazole glycerol phosphate synthase subunit HisH [Oscillospiraceae bacterium]